MGPTSKALDFFSSQVIKKHRYGWV
jgi:hypothetical protein